ncbi:MAG: hypothetical protein ABJA82_04255 [Myxococcales bacterium]
MTGSLTRACVVLGAASCCMLGGAAAARATEARGGQDTDSGSAASTWADYAPGAMDAPQLRNLEPRTRLYADGTLAQTDDLSVLPHIGGSGRNLRVALGGTLRWRRFQFEVELPASQATIVNIFNSDYPLDDTHNQIDEEDRHQTTLSIGDLRLGAQWTHALPIDAFPLAAGFGIRGRVPTHTTRFQFYNGHSHTTIIYALPYYFHIEPTVMVGGGMGPFSFVINQGAIAFLGPDGRVGDLPIVIPSLYFWDAHYAVACRIVRQVAVSVEVNTTMQLNHVEGLDFQKLNNVFAVVLLPGLQVHLGRLRLDLMARFGMTPGAELLGVIAFAGTRAGMLRATWVFD